MNAEKEIRVLFFVDVHFILMHKKLFNVNIADVCNMNMMNGTRLMVKFMKRIIILTGVFFYLLIENS